MFFYKEKKMKTAKKIGKVKALEMIRNSSGKVFGVTFVKKDGTIRKMTARLNVRRNIKGVGMNYNPRELGLITAFDMGIKEDGEIRGGYRMININTLMTLSIGGNDYKVG